MTRWTRSALLALSFTAAAACAQSFVREAPRDVKPGIIAVSSTPPVIAVDGQADRLSPGARVRDRNNMLVLSGALAGKTLYTVYRRDGAGLVHEVWLLNADEYARLGGKYGTDRSAVSDFQKVLNLIWGARATAAK